MFLVQAATELKLKREIPGLRTQRKVQNTPLIWQKPLPDKFQPCHWPLLAYVAFLA